MPPAPSSARISYCATRAPGASAPSSPGSGGAIRGARDSVGGASRAMRRVSPIAPCRGKMAAMAYLVVREPSAVAYTQPLAGRLDAGREEGNDLVLADGKASRRHARFDE